MKILVCCPGSWTYGLNSPERGEGRWAQNFSRMLAAAGYKVWACSAGKPQRDSQFGVNLISVGQARSMGKFDLYFDSSWWEGKKPYAKADKYFAVIWSLEKRFRSPKLSSNTYIGFPFDHQKDKFLVDANLWKEKTFCLPARYCETPEDPHFGKDKFIWSARDPQKPAGRKVIKALNDQYDTHKLKGIWMNSQKLDEYKIWKYIDKNIIARKINRTPYNEVRKEISNASLMVPVEGRSSVLDAITLGVAPIAYEGGISFPYVRTVARKYDLIVPKGFSPQDVNNVFDRLLTDKELYTNYVLDLQEHIYYNTQQGALEKFEEMIKKI